MTTTLTVLLLMAVPMAGVYAFVWALCRIAAIPTPIIPGNFDQCWTCGKTIPPGPDFCSEECGITWDVEVARARRAAK